MRKQTFRQWQPWPDAPRRIEIVGSRDEMDGFSVTVRREQSPNACAELRFHGVVAYRNINESYRLRTWHQNDMTGSSWFLIVEDSEWIAWLREESGGVLDDVTLTHYAVYTGDDCFDVIAREAPEVVVLEEPGKPSPTEQ
jgi:hypothetical protein